MFQMNRKGIRRLFVIPLCVFGLCLMVSTSSAFAAEWKFELKVPLEFKSMTKEVKNITVFLNLYKANQVEVLKEQFFQIKDVKSDGSLSTTLTFIVKEEDLTKGTYPGEVSTYKVSFLIYKTLPGGNLSGNYPNKGGIWTKSKPGTELVSEAVGFVGSFPIKLIKDAPKK